MSDIYPNLAACKDFLTEEVQVSPEEMYDEIIAAMSNLSTIKNKRNSKLTQSIWHTLLTCADMVQRMID